MTVGERLREARKKLGKRQLDIAEEIGVKQPTVSAWETDDGLPEAAKIRSIAAAYGIEPSDLLPGEPAPAEAGPDLTAPKASA